MRKRHGEMQMIIFAGDIVEGGQNARCEEIASSWLT